MTEPAVAFLGMGIMGQNMARNLAKSHDNVRIWNRTNHAWLKSYATEVGAHLADTINDAVNSAEIIFTCFTGPDDVTGVLFAEGGVASLAKKDAIIVDCSTIGPIAAREVGKQLEERGLNFLDAPVTGGDVGARDGTLTFMVGGREEIFKRCLPYLTAMGKRFKLCGPIGSGQSVKLCNQVLCAVNLVAVSEALNLAKTLEVDPALIIDLCGSGAGGSWSLTNLGPKILAEDYEPGFMLKDMMKDLDFVRTISPDLPGLKLAIDRFERAKALVGKDADRLGTQVMAEAYAKKMSAKNVS
jgi:3-hydroxyisobutyrate dehydrogenase